MTPTRGSKKAAPPAGRAAVPETLPLGGTGRTHPALGLGLWSVGRWEKDDEARTRTTLAHALDRGVPWIDTAEVYGTGRSERLLGDALTARPSAPRPFLTTKVSWEHLRPAQVRASIVGSLQRLEQPSVDVYLVHAPDPHVPIAETMEAMEALWREGKIGAIGVSNFSVPEMEAAQAALTEARIVVNQVRYNLLSRADGDPIVQYCRQHQIVIEAYTPMARGLLAGRYLTGKAPSPEVRRFARDLFDRDRFDDVRTRAKALKGVADDAGVPMASLALHWLESKGAAPVFGASRPEQVDDLLAAWAVRPDAAALERADEVTRGALD